MTPDQALRFIAGHGIVLESARHAGVANLADAVLGRRRRGSWWGHARGREFFRLTRVVRVHPDVLMCQLVAGKVTYLHRRLWPALVRLASTLSAPRLAALREVHTKTGAHRVSRTPLRRWVPAAVRRQAAGLTLDAARAQLGGAIPETLRPLRGPHRGPRRSRDAGGRGRRARVPLSAARRPSVPS